MIANLEIPSPKVNRRSDVRVDFEYNKNSTSSEIGL